MGRTIHFFRQYETDGKHEYIGEVEFVSYETQIHTDIDGKDREEYVFILKPV